MRSKGLRLDVCINTNVHDQVGAPPMRAREFLKETRPRTPEITLKHLYQLKTAQRKRASKEAEENHVRYMMYSRPEDWGRVLHVAWRCAVGGPGLEVSTSRPDPERRHHSDPAVEPMSAKPPGPGRPSRTPHRRAGGAGRGSFTAASARASPTRGRDGEDPMARPRPRAKTTPG